MLINLNCFWTVGFLYMYYYFVEKRKTNLISDLIVYAIAIG